MSDDKKIPVILAGKWNAGYMHEPPGIAMSFQFSDRAPITIALPPEQAEQMARAIIEAVRNPPPRRDRHN